jgi:PPIC-type PPIASE domain/FtsX-like permease family/MacB-like periplasmic core domain
MRFRRELGARWRGWLAVAVLAGVAGGLVLTAAAGARRTHSSLGRHLVAFRYPDAWIDISNDNKAKQTIRRVRSLPYVEASAVDGLLAYCARDAQNRSVGLLGPQAVQFLVNIAGRDGVALHRPKLLAGRVPDPGRPREVLVDTRAAQRFGVRPGGMIPIRVFPGWDTGELGVFHCDPRNRNPVQAGMPERREVRMILLSCHGAAACRRAKLAIDRLYVRLRKGANFGRLAKRYSNFPDAKQTGGKLWVEHGGQTPPAFDRLAFRLRTRELSRPIQTRFGWHIIEPLSRAVPVGPLIRLRVVGVKAATDPYPIGTVTLTPAFNRVYGFDSQYSDFLIRVKLRHGAADIAALRRDAGGVVQPEAADAAKIQRSIDHQAEALWLAAGFGALLSLLLLAPAILRLTSLAVPTHPTLRALGMTRRQLLLLDIARAGTIGLAAAGLAVALAFALSPLTPIGLARDLEPSPGFAADPLVLGLGGVAVLLVVVLAGAVAATQARTAPDLPISGRCASADALARWGLPATTVSGVRLALTRGSGTTAVPIAGTLLGAIASVAVVAVALTFTASMQHLLSTPRLYGQNWDYRTNYDAPPAARLRADPSISDAAEGDEADIRLNGTTVHVVAMDDVKGRIGPVVVEGRAPEGGDQIVVTSKTLNALGLHVGDTVEARGRRSVRMRIVGRGVLPESVSNQPRPAAAMTFQAYKRLNPSARFGVSEARIAPGADRQATLARLEREYAQPAPGPPQTIADFGGVRNLPVVVSALLAAVAAATLAQTLVTAIRRRRRQLAVLKTLGFDRRQLLATVAWQATTFAAIGLALGIPLGIAAGRWTWYLFAQQIEVVPEPVTPLPLVLLVIPAAILLANLVAALPGWSAAQTRAAAVLRAE